MSHKINPVSPCGGCGETWRRRDKPCYSSPGLSAPASAPSPPLDWAVAAPMLASCGDSTEPAPLTCHPPGHNQPLLPGFCFALQGFRENVPQTGDAASTSGPGSGAAPSFSVQVWQRVAQSLASLRTGLSHGKFGMQKFCNYLPFCFFFFTAKIPISLQGISLQLKAFHCMGWGFPSGFKTTFPLKISLREGFFLMQKSEMTF